MNPDETALPGDLSHRPPLDTDALARLAPAWHVTVVAASPSTHVSLATDARRGAARPGEVLVAEHQTAGRGRLDRTWTTPARAALTFSATVDPRLPAADWPWLPLLLGLAVLEGVESAGGPRLALKWPNDVMTPDGLKLGGLLAERVQAAPSGPGGSGGSSGSGRSSGSGPGTDLAVLSAGVNVTTRPDELPVPTATSLAAAGWERPDRTLLLVEVLGSLRARLDAWASGPAQQDRLRQEYADRCVTLGAAVRVTRPAGGPVEGTAVGVERDGSLVLQAHGERLVVTAGDVVHLRPA